MTTIIVLLVLAAIVKLMLVTVFAGVRYRRRHDEMTAPVAGDPKVLDPKWYSAPRRV
jgi:heme/copper-type cytochrome/quinol oxidase subunit 2